MSDTVIDVKGLGKKYRLGTIGTGSLSKDLNQLWARYIGKEDPYLKLDEFKNQNYKNNEFWALKDVYFQVKRGEILGIIGKNGAGKSSLLKIMSRITTPTTGEIKIKGRIASLLEVGTGFHGELTGKENIFLNGAILGMTKNEIKSKLDEIIDFSGVEKYIDTPVKRYSSGMYVRLAFAVAAHLEPEILIIDEVLAVGDSEFQKKCIGKMSQTAREGRTILFVSHNMASVQSLCTRGIVLDRGTIVFNGEIHDAVNQYLIDDKINYIKDDINIIDLSKHPNKQLNNKFGLQKAEIFVNTKPSTNISPGDNLNIKLSYKLEIPLFNPVLGIVINSPQNEPLIGVNNLHTLEKLNGKILNGIISFTLSKIAIYGSGKFGVDLYFGDNEDNFDIIKNAFSLNLIPKTLIEGGATLNPYLNRVYQQNITFKNE